MLRRLPRLLCSAATSRTLPNGAQLHGTFDAATGHLVSGVARLPDGRVFSGAFSASDGAPLPASRLEEDGDLYIGAFNSKWQRCGPGEAWLADGTVYKGTFADDELVEGVVRIPQGADEIVFEGTLRDESFVHGTLRQPGFTYTGEFQNNAPHGRGVLTYATGAVLEGTFRDGKLHGESCTMRLESGWVYMGTFVDGAISSGELRTPTYTYEGSFNRHGRAHGEGTQIQLVTDPKLFFTGIWVEGQMAQGTVTDEYGAPVDWQNRVDLQQQVKPLEQIATEDLVGSKVREACADTRARERDFVEDADFLRQTTGSSPTMAELGYDPAQGEASWTEGPRAGGDIAFTRRVVTDAAQQVPRTSEEVRRAVGEGYDPNAATKAALAQNSGNAIASENLRRQFARFAQDHVVKEPSHGDAERVRLNADLNTSWRTGAGTGSGR